MRMLHGGLSVGVGRLFLSGRGGKFSSSAAQTECLLVAKSAGTEVARISSDVTPTPGVEAEAAISGAERTRIASLPEAN